MFQDYTVVQDGMLYRLEIEVKRLMKQEGWQPKGGISVVLQKVNEEGDLDENGKEVAVFRQAMVR